MNVKTAWIVAAVGLVVALVLGGIFSPFASSHPDGLERVAEKKGFAEKGEGEPAFDGSPMPDYTVPAVQDEATSTRLAGVIGTLLAFAAGFGVAFVLRSATRKAQPQTPSET